MGCVLYFCVVIWLIDKTMKCITLFFSFCLIAIFSIAQPNYDFSKLKRERLGRGVIAIRENPSTVAVSWRYLSSDPMNESFDIYRNDEKINKHPLKDATFFQDTYAGTESVLYTVKAREGKTESSYQLPASPIGLSEYSVEPPRRWYDSVRAKLFLCSEWCQYRWRGRWWRIWDYSEMGPE